MNNRSVLEHEIIIADIISSSERILKELNAKVYSLVAFNLTL